MCAQGDADAVINVWINLDDLPAIAEAGQDALVSYGAYLDRQNPADGTHWMFFDTWYATHRELAGAACASGAAASCCLGRVALTMWVGACRVPGVDAC